MVTFLVILTGNTAHSQTTNASISGVITDANGEVLPGATISIRNESTGFNTATITNTKGEYTFKELPLGGPYTVKATYVGFGEQNLKGYKLNQGDAVKINFKLIDASNSLEVLEVVASGIKNKIENIGASTSISAKNIAQLPVNGRNFTSLMDLSPLSRGGNVAGQLGSSTNFTIDGMNSKNPTSAGATTSRSGAPYSISMEAVREFQVVTNQYDVTFGRAGGGTVSAVTKSGTNKLTGSVFNYTRANWLSSPYDIRGNKRTADFSTNQFGFSLGGPIIKDKLHFFAVWDHQADSRPLIIADVQSPADELRFNVTTGTLDRFVSIARDTYGTANRAQYGTFDKKRSSDAGFLRLDWQINNKNLFTIRNNFTSDVNKLGLGDNTTINLYESFGNDYNIDNSFLASLRTSISPKLTNELKLQHLYTFQDSAPGDDLPKSNIPRAIVERVGSTLSDGSQRNTNIQIGGHRFAQEKFRNNVFQLVNNLYYNSERVEYTFGTDLMLTNSYSVYGSEVNGRFHFTENTAEGKSAMDMFAEKRPYAYYREVPLMDDWGVTGNIFNAGLYGQFKAKPAKGLDITGGLRLDYAHYPSSPLNQELYNELQIRTDHKIKSFVVQPRVQLTWNIDDANRDIIRLGAGVFASDINNYVVINNLTFDGKHLATIDVRGNDVPTPNFSLYRNDYNAIPSLSQFQIPTINTNGSDAKVPVMYKANASYTRFLTDRLRVSASAFMTLGRNNYMYVDRNMVDNPFFRLENEDNRGVYVPLESMPANGAADWKQGRKSTKYGRVLELNSNGKINNYAVVIDANYRYFRDGEITASYTWSDTRDNTSYNGNVANTATLSLPVKDDPRDLSTMAYSSNHFNSKVVVFGSLPTFKGFSVGFRYSGIGGTRYTLLSGANSNGDFVAGTNDLAYIFDINDTSVPQRVRDGLKAILDNPNASQSIKDYILKNQGQIAERNGGVNNFYGTVDLRVAKRFNFGKTHGLELSVDVFNFGNLLSKKWGASSQLGTQALYTLGVPATATTAALPAFDRANKQYNYRVNTAGLANPGGNPYQIQIGARYSF